MIASERQKHLLQLVGDGLLRFYPAFGTWNLTISFYNAATGDYSGSYRQPSAKEAQTLLDFGWIELVELSDSWDLNTETGEKIHHQQAWLTPSGRQEAES